MTVKKKGGTLDFGATGEWSGGEPRGNMVGFVLGQARVGIDRLADEEDLVPPTPEQPQSSTDFLYAKSADLLSGDAGRWKTFFPPTQSGRPSPQLESLVRRVLATTGLAAQVAGFDVEMGSWGRLRAPHVTLEFPPDAEIDPARIHATLTEAWPEGGPSMPAITVTVDAFETTGAPAGPDGLLSTLVRERDAGRIAFGADLDAEQQAVLDAWAVKHGAGSTKNDARRLAALFRADTRLSEASGREALRALSDLGLMPPVVIEGMKILRKAFGDSALEDRRVFYNGHATLAMTSLLPALRAFGCAESNLWVSNSSGTRAAREILRLQGPDFFRSDTEEDRLKVVDCIYDLLVGRTEPLIVDKGRNVLDIIRMEEEKQTPFISDGRLRFVVHNRDDGLSAIVAQKGWAVDFANSLTKKLEARFIGEQYAMIGAREAREKLGARIGDTPTVIVGFGLLGEQLARALVRSGMDPSTIRVEERDPEVRARAAKLGFDVSPPETRPEKAMVYVATAGRAIDAANAGRYAKESVVMSLTSGGKGVKLEGGERGRAHRTAGGVLFDRAVTVPGNDANDGCLVHLISEGHPPNLADPMWNDRYALTALGVTAAMVQAGRLDKPGLEPIRRDVDRALVRLAKRLGLWERRPLEARAGEDPADLIADLDAFRPSNEG